LSVNNYKGATLKPAVHVASRLAGKHC